ncbi:MAG: AmmeMemoRadiSam system protein B [Methylohalobius sp.]|nr:AmmeMemoRadiSam system protein B [Methylohalobius sp.]
MTTVRYPAVAGLFYPDDAVELKEMLCQFLAAAKAQEPVPKAVIAPHAGYMYSGPVAASVYCLLLPAKDRIRRVVLIGPAHYVPFRGLAVPSVDAFLTPLGSVAIDHKAMAQIADLAFVQRLDAAHRPEHSLEVQLPFLQEILTEFKLVPIVVGAAKPEEVAEALERLWDREETLIVVSSDLSHYLDYQTATRKDAATSQAIQSLDPSQISADSACGATAIGGLLLAARKHGLIAKTLDLRNSGDTSGVRERVVGYGAYGFF